MGKYYITPEQLWSAFGGIDAPRVFDVRRRQAIDGDDQMIPGAIWQDPGDPAAMVDTLDRQRDVVIYCVHGHQVSQSVAAALRADTINARVLRGGIDAWRSAGLPTKRMSALPKVPIGGGSCWVTRRRPKVDRIACPWFVKRFIDPDATFLFVDPDQVLAVAEEVGGTAFDIEGAEITHAGDLCSFDVLLALSGLDDPALSDIARIVRGADTDNLELAPEAAGLLAMSIGVSALAGEDDQAAIEHGFALYDALYAWRRKAPSESHNWPTGSIS